MGYRSRSCAIIEELGILPTNPVPCIFLDRERAESFPDCVKVGLRNGTDHLLQRFF
jgi:hypothetical protein